MVGRRIKRGLVNGCILVIVLVVALLVEGKTSALEAVSPETVLPNYDEVITQIRDGLCAHGSRITITFACNRDISEHIPGFVESWMEAAMQETDQPNEGDYIRYQTGGYDSSFTYESGTYTVKIVPRYYLYLPQEEAATGKLAEIFEGFGFTAQTTDYEKIKTIYDYLCTHVTYDVIHQKNPHYYMRSTAYAALAQETATCQGYSVALYRMLRQAGIDCRIVTGTGYWEDTERYHAWNIVELDGVYYNLDATWDAGEAEYSYFLKGSDSFSGHVPGETFLTEDFTENYPISKSDYVIETLKEGET